MRSRRRSVKGAAARRKRALLSCGIAVLSCAVLPTGALAEGASTISAAPVVVFGQQEFGDTGSGVAMRHPDGLTQFWNLDVLTGDQITIDWEATAHTETYLYLYPPGTDDYSIEEARHVLIESEDSQGRGEADYVAKGAGTMPLAFASGGRNGHTLSASAYNFTAYVKHALVVDLPRMATLPDRKTVSVSVHNLEGGEVTDPGLTVTLEAQTVNGWKQLGRATVRASIAGIKASVPRAFRGRSIAVRATASGADYLKTSSRVIHCDVP